MHFLKTVRGLFYIGGTRDGAVSCTQRDRGRTTQTAAGSLSQEELEIINSPGGAWPELRTLIVSSNVQQRIQ